MHSLTVTTTVAILDRPQTMKVNNDTSTIVKFWTRKPFGQWKAAGIGWSFSIGKMPQNFCTLYPTVLQKGPVQNIEDQSEASLDLDPSTHGPGGWHFAS